MSMNLHQNQTKHMTRTLFSSPLLGTDVSNASNVGEEELSFTLRHNTAIVHVRAELRGHQEHIDQHIQTFEVGRFRCHDLKHGLHTHNIISQLVEFPLSQFKQKSVYSKC